METSITLLKISENEYRMDGFLNYREESYSQVVIDGETYSKRIVTDHILDLSKDFNDPSLTISEGSCYVSKGHWRRYDFDELTPFGLSNIIIWERGGFQYPLWRHIKSLKSCSENPIVNVILSLPLIMEVNKKKVRDLYRDTRDSEREYNILSENCIGFPVYSYGFNNSVYARIPLKHFFLIPPKNLKRYKDKISRLQKFYPDLFPKYIQDRNPNEIELTQIFLNLLKRKIKLKQQRS